MQSYWYTFVAATVAVLTTTIITQAAGQSCSRHDASHSFSCPSGQSINRVSGSHSNRREDRIYCYGCRNNFRNAIDCYQTGYVNSFDNPVATLCRPHYYIAGVYSYHDNGREDRRFNYRCCRNVKQCTKNCHLTGPVNNFDGRMNYNLGRGQVMVGAFSWHRNDKEDRQWWFQQCELYNC